MENNVDIVQASDRYCGGGFWSGTESRHRKRFIAMVPASRYRDSGTPRNAKNQSEKHQSLAKIDVRLA
jgi:hypothetical protein